MSCCIKHVMVARSTSLSQVKRRPDKARNRWQSLGPRSESSNFSQPEFCSHFEPALPYATERSHGRDHTVIKKTGTLSVSYQEDERAKPGDLSPAGSSGQRDTLTLNLYGWSVTLVPDLQSFNPLRAIPSLAMVPSARTGSFPFSERCHGPLICL